MTGTSILTTAEMQALCATAGLTPDEMQMDPDCGLLVSASGARKLAAIAPDQVKAQQLIEYLSEVRRTSLRLVGGTDMEGAASL